MDALDATDGTALDATDHPAAGSDAERGQGMVEYAFILMLVALVLIISVQVLGHTTSNMFSNVANSLGSP
ncbi:MAG TPA: Flp family type IVb pilin [Candidatus Dormibacteraeota bacterium]|nr:Flp family type IVb pilin [Candidatus Dormibacteraeota bacterium]